METTHRNIHDIITELRAHPDACAVIVWVPEDAGDFDPDSVDWGAVEDRGIEIGHEVIHDTGSPFECPTCKDEGVVPCDDPDGCDGSCEATGGMSCPECDGLNA